MPDLERHGVERVRAIATSAVRDAANRDMFLAELRERFALDAEILDGAEEARLTYLGAYAERPPAEKTMVVDIGGGSTELVIGDGPDVGFSASLQAGTVRHTERHLAHDPPEAAELETARGRRQRADRRGARGRGLRPRQLRDRGRRHADLAGGDRPAARPLRPGARPRLPALARVDPADARACSPRSRSPSGSQVVGLHEGRAPTIVAGVVILIQVMRAFGLSEIEVSEHDILWGAALAVASDGRGALGDRDVADGNPSAQNAGFGVRFLLSDAEAALAPGRDGSSTKRCTIASWIPRTRRNRS